MNIQTPNMQTIESTSTYVPQPEDVSELQYFPTQIFQHKVPEDKVEALNADLLEKIYAERERDRKGIQRSNFQALGGWHSHNDLHKEDAFQNIVSIINGSAKAISEKNAYHQGFDLNIGTMWSIVNPPGSSNRAHIHPSCAWSGVYYVHAPENSGNIEFVDPRTENLMRPARYIANRKRPKSCWTKVNFTPMAGKMLIFPSWLYHSVAPNLSTGKGKAGERVILSFNLNQSKSKS